MSITCQLNLRNIFLIFAGAHCIECHKEIPIKSIEWNLLNGTVAICPACKGYVKPDIVFFGESLPARFFSVSFDFSSECKILKCINEPSMASYPVVG